MPSPIPFTVTLRRSHDACINQRIDSLPCPALLSMFPGRLAHDNYRRGRGFHQTATIGLRRRTRLDYVLADVGVAREQSGMWLIAGRIEVRKGL